MPLPSRPVAAHADVDPPAPPARRPAPARQPAIADPPSRHVASRHASAALGLRQDRARRLRAGALPPGRELLSTGGTAQRAAPTRGFAVTEVGDYTGFPEILDGRVKTLHPKVHGGILARRDLPAHAAALARARHPADRSRRRQPLPVPRDGRAAGCTLEDAIENIDIGGPTMVRAAAKNSRTSASSSTRPTTPALLAELEARRRALSAATRFALAAQGVRAHRRVRRRDRRTG